MRGQESLPLLTMVATFRLCYYSIGDCRFPAEDVTILLKVNKYKKLPKLKLSYNVFSKKKVKFDFSYEDIFSKAGKKF